MARKKPPAVAADDLLTSPTAAQIAGLERVYFARLIREGKGPKHQRVKAGSRTLVLIVRSDLDAWIASRKG
jgi:predicted DNA-binding transcriptional regulator AlpA